MVPGRRKSLVNFALSSIGFAMNVEFNTPHWCKRWNLQHNSRSLINYRERLAFKWRFDSISVKLLPIMPGPISTDGRNSRYSRREHGYWTSPRRLVPPRPRQSTLVTEHEIFLTSIQSREKKILPSLTARSTRYFWLQFSTMSTKTTMVQSRHYTHIAVATDVVANSTMSSFRER